MTFQARLLDYFSTVHLSITFTPKGNDLGNSSHHPSDPLPGTPKIAAPKTNHYIIRPHKPTSDIPSLNAILKPALPTIDVLHLLDPCDGNIRRAGDALAVLAAVFAGV